MAQILRIALVLSVFFSVGQASSAEIVKSPNDHRSYEYRLLDNGLKVLLISDPETDKAAASLNVRVGSGRDPANRLGLAHFLEHMLFLGTEKYPEPDAYKSFISSHGGSQNAYTSHEHTNYYFDVDSRHLEPALDRFAQFFVAPLFNEEYVAREVNAVDSEFHTQKQNDGWRSAYAKKLGFNPVHPLSRFATGNLATLSADAGSSVRAELLAFHAKYYSANAMTLVVLGKESLVDLGRWVEDKFRSINATETQPALPAVSLLAPGEYPKRINLIPVKDSRSLSMIFSIPPTDPHYRQKPAYLISTLLGHEGKGSLLSYLKRQGWAERLSAGYGTLDPHNGNFTVNVRLTPKGLHRVDDIIAAVFDYLRLIQSEGLHKWVFDEQRRLFEIAFRFQEDASPARYVRVLAADMHDYPPEHILNGPYLLETFDKDLVQRFMDYLAPENLLVLVTGKGLAAGITSPWMEFRYGISSVPPETVTAWTDVGRAAELSLPEPNAFVPEDLTVESARESGSLPREIERRPGFSLWHMQDIEFREPRADFFFTVKSPTANSNARNSVLTTLFVEVVNDQLNEFSYPADVAGLEYSLYTHTRGFSVRVSGYNDKQARLLDRIIAAIRQPKFDPRVFDMARRKLIRGYANRAKNAPNQQVMSSVIDLILKPHWLDAALLEAVQGVDLNDLRRFVPELLRSVDVTVLAHGNLLTEDAQRMGRMVKAAFATPNHPAIAPRGAIVRIPPGKRYVHTLDVDHHDSATAWYFQADGKSFAERAISSLLIQVVSSSFFSELRTRQQLGYVVFATSMSILETPGIAFVVQSPNATPTEISSRTQAFVEAHVKVLSDMDEVTFARHKKALVTKLSVKDKTMYEVSDRYWTELDRKRYSFDTREQLISAVKSIRLDEFRRFYHGLLLGSSSKGILVQTLGTGQKAAGVKGLARGLEIDEPREFKQMLPTFPDVSETRLSKDGT